MSNWIRVEDRLPEHGKRVLIYGKGNRMITAIWFENCFLDYWGEECEEITHWQPLPEPPSNQ